MSARKPCAECPFARAVKAGTLGGSDASVYIGQSIGPFMLPCHLDKEYEADRRSVKLTQCAGAATFRSNIGVDDLMPKGILTLPANDADVFSTPAEFLAHHLEVTVEKAQEILNIETPADLLRRELREPGVQLHKATAV